MTQTFTCTSIDLYDRHEYEITLISGKKVIFDNWEDTFNYWWNNRQIPEFLNYISVKDKQKINKKGFAQ
jgi:hypothetical protein